MESLEKLHFRSDGFSETSSGLFGVIMLVKGSGAGGDEGQRIFRYRPNMMADPVEVSWNENELVSLFPPAVSTHLVRQGFSRNPTSSEVTEFNEEQEILQASLKAEADAAKAKLDAALALAAAETKVKADAAAKAKADAEAKAKAKVEADAKAEAKAKDEADARAKALAEAKAKLEAEKNKS